MSDPRARVILEAVRVGDAAFTSFQADLGKIATSAKVIGAAAAAALVYTVKQSYEAIDALGKESDALGISTQRLAGYKLAADLAGVSQEQLSVALRKQRDTVYDAFNGVDAAEKSLGRLGLQAKDLIGLSLDDQFLTISDALNKVENATARGSIAADIFGSKQRNILNLVSEGREGLEGYVDEAERLGIAVSRFDASKIEQANDAALKAKMALQSFGNALAIESSHLVVAAANALTHSLGGMDSMRQKARLLVDGLVYGIGLVADSWRGWQLIIAQSAVFIEDLKLAFTSFVRTSADMAETLAEAFSWMPGMGFALENVHRIQGMIGDESRDARDAAQAHLEALIAMPAPSERLVAALERVRAETEKIAAETAATAQARQDLADAAPPPPPEDEKAKRAREAAERDLAKLHQERQRALEEELAARIEFGQITAQKEIELRHQIGEAVRVVEEDQLRQRLLDAVNARQQDLISQEEFAALSEELALQHEQRLSGLTKQGLTQREQFERMSAQKKTQFILGQITSLTAGVAQSNKTMFTINKAAALAEAVVNTAAGVTQALRAYPPPISFAMAALVAAAGAAQISAIRATQFGGGTTPSLAGTTGSVGGEPVSAAPSNFGVDTTQRGGGQIVQVYIQAPIYGLDEMETAELIGSRVRDLIDNNDFKLMSPDSRNAVEVRVGG